ncbi:hypothetical protein DL769_009832 [Monosporascus sp. CRB-8-3]|nr:hypothetical protein DL769_009832 [Monosporascus sp. CRB-8-3]
MHQAAGRSLFFILRSFWLYKKDPAPYESEQHALLPAITNWRLIQRNCIRANICIVVLELLDLHVIPHNHSIYAFVSFFAFSNLEHHIFRKVDQLDYIVRRNNLNTILSGNHFQYDNIEYYHVL